MEMNSFGENLVSESTQVEELSKMITHNLRAPVARLLGLTTILKNTQDGESMTFLVDKIEKSAREFDSIIKDFSLMLQARKGNHIFPKPVSLTNKINQALSLLEEDIKEANALVLSNVSSEHFINGIDAYALSIFLNLISNSLKYKANKPLVISIDSFIEPGRVVLIYKDNGLGIDLIKYGNLLFLPNKRFHPGTEGNGLGLYFIKRQIQEMGGSIFVESVVGIGTTFKISLISANNLFEVRY